MAVPTAYLLPELVVRPEGEPEPPPGPPAPVAAPSPYRDVLGEEPSPLAAPQEPDVGLTGRYWNSLKDAGSYLWGEGRSEFPDVPNLLTSGLGATGDPNVSPMQNPKLLPLFVGYALGARGDQLSELAAAALPGSELHKDAKDNHMIRYRGREYYLAKPGIGLQDIAGAIGQTAVAAAAGGGIGAIPALAARGVMPTIVQGAAQALGQGAATLGTGQTIASLGGGSGAKPEDVALSAAFGGGGSIMGRAAGAFWNMVKGEGQLITDTVKKLDAGLRATPSMLTATGKAVLDKAKVSASDFTVADLLELQRTVGPAARSVLRQKTQPGQISAAEAAVASARQGTPMSLGQLSGNPLQLWLEKNMRAAGPGQPLMDSFDKMQRQRLEAAAGRVVPGATQAGVPPDEAALGTALQSTLQRRGATLEGRAGQLWDDLGPLTPIGEARRPDGLRFGQGVTDLVNAGLRDVAENRTLQSGMTNARDAVRAVRDLIWSRTPDGHFVPSNFNLGRLQKTRRDLNDLIKLSGDDARNPDTAYVIALKGKLDDALDQAVADGMITGDPDRLGMLKDALAATGELKGFWNPKNKVALRFMKDLRDGELNGDQVFKALFGASQLNSASGTQQILNHIRAQFGDDPVIWNQIRSAALRRTLFSSTEKGFEMNPLRIDQRIEELLAGDGATLARQIGLPVKQLRELQDTARILQQSQNRQPSNTAGDLYEAVRRALMRMPVVSHMLNNDARIAAQARTATGNNQGARLTPEILGDMTQVKWNKLQSAVGATTGGLLGPSVPAMVP